MEIKGVGCFSLITFNYSWLKRVGYQCQEKIYASVDKHLHGDMMVNHLKLLKQ